MDTTLTVTEGHWKAVQDALQDVTTEHMAVAGAGLSESDDGCRFLARRLHLPGEEDYDFQSAGGVRLTADAVAEIMTDLHEHPVLVDMHNHPTANPRFSSTDDDGARVQYELLQDFHPGAVLAQLVFGGPNGGFQGRYTEPGLYPEWKSIDTVEVIGQEDGISRHLPWDVHGNQDSLAERWTRGRHVRTIPIIGDVSLHEIAKLRLGIVGLGGTGSIFLQQAKFYFPRLTLVDDDHVEESNMGRLFGATRQDATGMAPKAKVAARELRRFDPEVEVETVPDRFPSPRAKEALKGCDVIACCVDNDRARYRLAEFCGRHMKVLVEMGSGLQMEDGDVTSVGCQSRLQVPGGPCLSCLNLRQDTIEFGVTIESKRESGYIEDSDLTPGEVVTTNSTAATLSMRNLLALLGGHLPRPVPTYVFYDEMEPLIMDLTDQYPAREECVICSEANDDSVFGWGDQLPDRLQIADPPQSPEEILQ